MEHERRDFFRIPDRAALRVTPVEDINRPPEPPIALQKIQGLLQELHNIDEENQLILRNITDKSRELGQYLRAQQRKQELLTRHLILQQTDHYFDSVAITLSGSGIGFVSLESYEPTHYLDLDIVLFPEAWCASLRARVISCTKNENHYTIGAEFINVSVEQRDALVRHCLLIDGHQRRKEKEE